METLKSSKGGFDYSLTNRNKFLSKTNNVDVKKLGAKKTGTTIVGCVFKDGIVLGADTRATEGAIVCDKNCYKIHTIANNIQCCGAGTASDTEHVTELVKSQLVLHSYATKTEPKVITALTHLKRRLFKYQGHIGAALILGGVDTQGSHLYTIYPHGSVSRLPFATMGSGSLAAMSVFETGYKDDMDEKEAIALVDKAIKAGIFNDLGSGSNVDVCVIKKGQTDMLRNYSKPNERKFNNREGYKIPRGTTHVKGDGKKFMAKAKLHDLYKNLVIEELANFELSESDDDIDLEDEEKEEEKAMNVEA